MRVELHVLQNFAPSNLNRDDTGAPKDCDFGGHRRARISSQSQKRAVREVFRLTGLVPEEELGARTKRLAHRIAEEMSVTHGMQRDEAARLAVGAIRGVGLAPNKKGSGEDLWKTEYLLFVPRRIVKSLANLLYEKRDELGNVATADTEDQPDEETQSKKRTSKKDAKKKAKAAYPKQIGDEVTRLLEDARSTVDLALFGRMIADKPDWTVDASCQVAHAISTNRVQMDFDFFTAVDDFKPGETAGSDMMGSIQFNSSCFYRYAVLDVDALRNNLNGGGDESPALIQTAVGAFVRAFVSAIPTGKQNSMAAHNAPSYVLAIVRDGGQPVSLANAFLKPARPRLVDGSEVDLVDDSIDKLESYLFRVRDWLGCGGHVALTWADRDVTSREGGPERAISINDFFERVSERALGQGAKASRSEAASVGAIA